MGHALESGLLDLADVVIVDAQLLQALGHVGGHFLEDVPGQVEALQLGQWAEGLVVDGTDLVVHQDQSLCGREREKVSTHDPRCLGLTKGPLQSFLPASPFLF